MGAVAALVAAAWLPASRAPVSAAEAGIVFRGATSSSSKLARSSVSLARPGGTVSGDVLLASLVVNDDDPLPVAPSGWTLVRQNSVLNVILQTVYVHVATSAEPASYTWKLSAGRRVLGGVSAYGGVDPAKPIDAQAGLVSAGSGTAIIAPSATTSSAAPAAPTASSPGPGTTSSTEAPASTS
jgi:hypothetical protein